MQVVHGGTMVHGGTSGGDTRWYDGARVVVVHGGVRWCTVVHGGRMKWVICVYIYSG